MHLEHVQSAHTLQQLLGRVSSQMDARHASCMQLNSMMALSGLLSAPDCRPHGPCPPSHTQDSCCPTLAPRTDTETHTWPHPSWLHTCSPSACSGPFPQPKDGVVPPNVEAPCLEIMNESQPVALERAVSAGTGPYPVHCLHLGCGLAGMLKPANQLPLQPPQLRWPLPALPAPVEPRLGFLSQQELLLSPHPLLALPGP